MFFQQIKVEGLGCLSYIIGCPLAGKAVVVDPKRDVDDYVRICDENGMKIIGIIETHIHADHISGGRELCALTGADIYVHETADVSYDHKKLHDGSRLEIGNAVIDVLHTPGHTPNSISLAVADLSRSTETELLLTGDLLFVGSVGRPDLAGGELLEQQVENLYTSLHEKLKPFPDLVEIYPAHGQGSLCGSGLSAKTSSTLGFERKNNPYFKLSFEDFKQQLTAETPFRPRNFTHIIETNKEGANLLANIPGMLKLTVSDLKDAIADGRHLVDLRDASSFGGAHIPGSLNIGFTPQSATWLGTVVDPAGKVVLIADSGQDIDKAGTLFRKAGYDNITGYFIGISAWIANGEETGFLPQLSIHGLKRVMKKYRDHTVVDVRREEEWRNGHIKEAVHLPLHILIEKGIDMKKDAHLSVVCGTGYRSNIAASILKSRGFEHVYSVIGGMNAWKKVYETET